MGSAIPEIISQHAEEAAFLWSLRCAAVGQPHYRLSDIARLDERIESHIDGLRTNGNPAIEFVTTMSADDPGALFAAAVLAIERGDHDRIAAVLHAATSDPSLARGFISALGWLPFEGVEALVRQLCASNDSARRRIGIAASAIHRQHPAGGRTRNPEADAADTLLQARACRAWGELAASVEALSAFQQLRPDADAAVQFWAAWACALSAGNARAIAALQAIATAGGLHAAQAAALAVRRMDALEAMEWWEGLSERPSLAPVAIAAAGALGMPDVIDWLIQRMPTPALARRAGEAFSLITGAHIAYDKLERPRPEGFESGPNDDPDDENVAMDPDENLAWPDPKRTAKWWAKYEGQFHCGTRYLLGKPIDLKSANDALRHGYQRQRAAAAIELAILQPGEPLFEVRAPASRQRKLLDA